MTDDGIATELKAVQFLKALNPIVSKPSFKLTVFSEEQPSKHCDDITRRELGIVTDRRLVLSLNASLSSPYTLSVWL